MTTKVTGSVLSNTGVTAAQYGGLNQIPFFNVDAQGRITSSGNTSITTALGFTPYNSTNPSGFITGINGTMVTNALGYTPVQQGGIGSQGTNKIYIGWNGTRIELQVDSTNFGANWPINFVPAIDGIGSYRTHTGAYTAGTSYAAATIGASAGTWRAISTSITGVASVLYNVTTYNYITLFLRIS